MEFLKSPLDPICHMPEKYHSDGYNPGGPILYQLPLFRPLAALEECFRGAPQFKHIPSHTLIAQARGGLKVVLLTDDHHYAVQAAVYLAALQCCTLRQSLADGFGLEADELDVADELDAPDALDELAEDVDLFQQECTQEERLWGTLCVVSPAQLDPSPDSGNVLQDMRFWAYLLAAKDGPVLTPASMDGLRRLMHTYVRFWQLPDVFVQLRPGQMDRGMLEELRFAYGFHVCRVGRPDKAYLAKFLASEATEYGQTLDRNLKFGKVLRALRRYRGSRFQAEHDLGRLLAWAVQRHKSGDLTTEDLIFRPWRSGDL